MSVSVELCANEYCIINAQDGIAAFALTALEEEVQSWLDENPGWQPCGGPSLTYQPNLDEYIAMQAFVTMLKR